MPKKSDKIDKDALRAKKMRAKRRQKRLVAFIWCTLECIFITGYTNGWVWIKEALLDQNYYLNECNITTEMIQEIKKPKQAEEDTRVIMFGLNDEIENSVDIVHTSSKLKCVYRKVLKEMTIVEYNILMAENKISERVRNVTDIEELRCMEQYEMVESVHTYANLCKLVLTFPLWFIFDTYGTSRTRILAMCGTAIGSLTMLFSSEYYPWLVFPALLTLGLSGSLILLTDLQVANLFGGRRYTIMSIFVGAYFSGGIVIFFMKLTKESGVSLQTSFMFTTIGIVPVLISTIAMLPKSRIPWPVPATYGKGRTGNSSDKTKALQRRMSVGPKKKINMTEFWRAIKSKLFILSVLWFSLLSLKIRMVDITIESMLQQNYSHTEVGEYMSWYGIVLLLSLPLSPLIGIVMDWNRKNVTTQPHVAQMRNILLAMCLQMLMALVSTVTSFFPNIYTLVITYIFVTIEKVSLHAVLFAFLMHVNFPSEHFGKLAGIVLSVSGIILILQFPLKLLVQHSRTEENTYLYTMPFGLLFISCLHPVCVWYQCRIGHINNSAGTNVENDRTVTVVLIESSSTKTCGGSTNARDDKNSSTFTEASKLQITDL